MSSKIASGQEDDTEESSNKRVPQDMRDIADKVGPIRPSCYHAKICLMLQPPVDFFGRLITEPSATSTKAAVRKNVEKKYRVTYRFAEGTSAAVRKPVKIAAFL